MANSDFRPAAGNFGETYVALSRTLIPAVITAAGTIRHFMPIVAAEVTQANQTELLFYKGGALVFGGAVSLFTLATTARVVKRSAGGVFTPMSGSVTIATGLATGSVLAFPLSGTITDDQRTVRPNAGDTVCIEITNAATGVVTTQPADVLACVKLAVLR